MNARQSRLFTDTARNLEEKLNRFRDLFRAKEVLGNQVCLKGNVPLSLLLAGTPDEVRDFCKRLIDEVGRSGGFIMDTSTVIDDARPENVRAMFDVTREYGG